MPIVNQLIPPPPLQMEILKMLFHIYYDGFIPESALVNSLHGVQNIEKISYLMLRSNIVKMLLTSVF